MNGYVDLHTHSCYSDGTDSPEAIIYKAAATGIRAVALTDHDTVAGLDEFSKSGQEQGVETVPGIEISTQMRNIEVHILGYYLDHRSDSMKNFLIGQKNSRREKIDKMLVRLREMGFDIKEEDFTGSKGIVTRGSVAGVMHKKGFVRYKKEAFEKYIGEGQPAFVDRERIGAIKAVELIVDCGGIPVIAHPYLYEMEDDEFESEIKTLTDAGLRGIEVLYPEGHTDGREMFYRTLAKKYSLLITGGSDYHGDNKTVKLGFALNNKKIPYEIFEALKECRV